MPGPIQIIPADIHLDRHGTLSDSGIHNCSQISAHLLGGVSTMVRAACGRLYRPDLNADVIVSPCDTNYIKLKNIPGLDSKWRPEFKAHNRMCLQVDMPDNRRVPLSRRGKKII